MDEERMRLAGLGHAQGALQRYLRREARRKSIKQRQKQGEKFPDSPSMIEARAERLAQQWRVERNEEPLGGTKLLLLGEGGSFPWNWLARGASVGRTVLRISRLTNPPMPVGTGFLVSPRLLLTAAHVLPDPESAAHAFVEFEVQSTIDGTPATPKKYHLEPHAFFAANRGIDYAFVQVGAGSDGQPPGETFGWNRLSASPGKVVIGEPINIIGHPGGRPKEASVRDCRVQDRLDNFLHYGADTEPGSAGSPVFNDQWEVVAVHHSKVPRTDREGRVLRLDGQYWQPGDGEEAIDWLALEGVRISSILRDLAKSPISPRKRSLLAEMGAASGFREE
ncbi:trypsin-like serine peptidase [Streptomyces sp. NPDC012746]|uniref:trypsin-like serine peptidase n=1 Tax=Streptomyces sp. NPDC012746 TaxID=3364845 RepID=UPI0036A355B9